MRVGRGNHEAFGTGLVAAARLVPVRDPPLPGALARALPTQVRHPVRRSREERREGHPGSHGGCVPGLSATATSTASTRHSWSTTRHSIAASRTGELRDRHAAARPARGLSASGPSAAAPAPGSLRATDVAESAAFAGEYSALEEADIGLALGRASDRVEMRISALERGGSQDRARRAREPAVTRAWQRLLGFVPTRACRRRAPRRSRSRVFWLEALGWPMAKGRDTWDYLVYYLQLADADPPISELQLFRTPLTPLVLGLPLRARRERAPGGRVRLSCTQSRSSPGARRRSPSGAFPRSSPRGSCSSTRRSRRCTTRRRATPSSPPGSRSGRSCSRARCARRRPGASLALGAGSPRSSSSGRRIRCSCRSRSSRCSCPSPGAGVSSGRASVLAGSGRCSSAAGRSTTACATTTPPWHAAAGPGCRSSSCSRATGRSPRRTGRRRGGSPA